MIDLSPMLRRAQTAFVNFDQRPAVAVSSSAAQLRHQKAAKELKRKQEIVFCSPGSPSKSELNFFLIKTTTKSLQEEEDDTFYPIV